MNWPNINYLAAAASEPIEEPSELISGAPTPGVGFRGETSNVTGLWNFNEYESFDSFDFLIQRTTTPDTAMKQDTKSPNAAIRFRRRTLASASPISSRRFLQTSIVASIVTNAGALAGTVASVSESKDLLGCGSGFTLFCSSALL